MRFSSPETFWFLLLIPLLCVFFAWATLARRKALLRFVGWPLAEKLTRDFSRRRQFGKYALFGIGTLWAVVALCGPQFGAKLDMAQRKGVDVVLVLDVSRSMLAEDLKPSRLARAKQQIRELIDLLQGDRVGLIVFAGQAFVQCPLTLDYGAVDMFLDVLDAGMIPVQGTAIGDALRLAARTFDAEDEQHKVVVLFTDGEDHISEPLVAAQDAAEQGIHVFAIGLGTAGGELIPEMQQGGGTSYHKDERGNYVKTRLDEATLKEIALSTNGGYFRSSLAGQELVAISEQIAQMDQKEFASTRFTQYEERFQFPLFLALCCFFIEAFLGDKRARSVEWKGRFE
ncbi:MAG: VWA domain-containing protein [Candidatus Latescibacterota bacterium]|nr:VWA domain-containing protein [Candidatus Latescibacterota bacterium]